MNFHDRAAVDQLLEGLDVLDLIEEDRDGAMVGGTKHWHVFHIVARATDSYAHRPRRDTSPCSCEAGVSRAVR